MLGRRNALALGMGKVELLEDEDGQVLEKLAPDIQVMEVRNWRMGSEAYEKKMVHHEGIKKLWEAKWKFPCSINVYPFHDGKFEDFERIFKDLIEKNINDGTSPEYTKAFFIKAASLTALGDAAMRSKNPILASDLYLRAACLYRIARFPYITSFPTISCSVKWEAWTLQKAVYLKAARTWEQPITEVMIPLLKKEGRDKGEIPVYVRMPKQKDEKMKQKVPVVLLMTGLDGYRPDNTLRSQEFINRGWGTIIVEIPGTADCPADPADPKSGDRLWSSAFEWMEKDGRFEMGKCMVWGLSAGGYYAVRVAHTHRERLKGVVAQGAGVHEFFDREWVERADGHEYPFLLSPAMAMKHGYDSVEEYKIGAQKKFSLLENGILDRPSTRLLLVNGTHDGLMPIEDSMMLLEHGSPKEARFFDKAFHMGYPMANASVYPWMESVMAD